MKEIKQINYVNDKGKSTITKTFDIESGCSEIITNDKEGLAHFDPS